MGFEGGVVGFVGCVGLVGLVGFVGFVGLVGFVGSVGSVRLVGLPFWIGSGRRRRVRRRLGWGGGEGNVDQESSIVHGPILDQPAAALLRDLR